MFTEKKGGMKRFILILLLLVFSLATFAQSETNPTGETYLQDQVLAYVKQGEAKYKQGDYKSALVAYDKAIALNDTLADAYFQRASTKTNLEDYEGALEDFSRVIKLDSAHVFAYYLRGDLKHKLGFQRDSSLYDLNKAIELAPDNSLLYAKRAEVKSNTHDLEAGKINFDDAIADLDKAIELDPNNADFYRQRGFNQSQKGSNLTAAENFDKAIAIDKGNPEYYNERGLLRLKLEDFKGASEDFSNAINLEGDKEYLFRNRGLARYNSRDFQGAISDYTKSIELISEQLRTKKFNRAFKYKLTNAYLLRGSSFMAMRKNYEGCSDFRKAEELGERRAINYLKKYCNF